MTERYLVTGSRGFVGRYVVREALGFDGVSVLGIGRANVNARAPLPGSAKARSTYEAVDVRDTERLMHAINEFAPTAIIHLASGLRDDPPAELLQINVAGTLSLFEAVGAADVPSPRVVIGSSGGVYGRSTQLPLAEDAPCWPIDFYSASKLSQEHVGRVAGADRGIEVVVARLFNVIGSGQDERHASARFARQLVEASRRGDVTPIQVGDLTPTRDFVDVRDVASALLLLARGGRPGSTYNVGSGRETSIGTLLELTYAAIGLQAAPNLAQTYHRAADIPRHVADVSKLLALGHAPRYDLAQSVRDLIAYYQDFPEEAAQCG